MLAKEVCQTMCLCNNHYNKVLGEISKKSSKDIDCWLNKPSKRSPVSSTAREREFVLDPKPPPLSLGN